MKKVGLIINPIAGMGGKVGLKGTDGLASLHEAVQRGAKPEAHIKAGKALKELEPAKNQIIFYTGSQKMGQDLLDNMGFHYQVIYQQDQKTQTDDTLQLTQRLRDENVDLILFAGGDGTARDIASVLETTIPVIGIPAGVKIHSPVYATSPEHAGKLALSFIQGEDLPIKAHEVIDIEENAFRRDEIVTSVYGYLNVPYHASHLQNLKSPTPQSDEDAQVSAALDIIDHMESDVYYIIGSGSTVAPIMTELGLEPTLLGIDIIQNKQLVKKDVYEQEILDIIQDQPAKLIVTPMGGQGYLFGRGNHQLSDKVLSKQAKEDIIVVATAGKLQSLNGQPLLIYTGNREVDRSIEGYHKVHLGYEHAKMYKIMAV